MVQWVILFGGQVGVHRLMHGISGNLNEFMHILSGMTYPMWLSICSFCQPTATHLPPTKKRTPLNCEVPLIQTNSKCAQTWRIKTPQLRIKKGWGSKTSPILQADWNFNKLLLFFACFFFWWIHVSLNSFQILPVIFQQVDMIFELFLLFGGKYGISKEPHDLLEVSA